jgi:hypothetical protein
MEPEVKERCHEDAPLYWQPVAVSTSLIILTAVYEMPMTGVVDNIVDDRSFARGVGNNFDNVVSGYQDNQEGVYGTKYILNIIIFIRNRKPLELQSSRCTTLLLLFALFHGFQRSSVTKPRKMATFRLQSL